MFANTLEALKANGTTVRHIALVCGAKSYGRHIGPYKTRAKESDPRILGSLFYNDQEDFLAEWSARNGASWTVLRPDGIVGPSLGSPMNLAQGIGVYAAICRELGLPLRFPGSLTTWSSVLHQLTDTAILGRAVLWSLDAVTARGEIFNVINGDQFRWKHISPEIAAAFEMTVEEPQPMPLTT